MVWIPPMEQYLQEVNFDFYRYSHYSKLVITASFEGFSPTAILHNGLATLNWTPIYDSKRNVVAYGTEIEINRYYSNHSIVHSGNGKLSVQVQGYFYSHIIYGWPAVVIIGFKSSFTYLLDVILVCNFSCGNGICMLLITCVNALMDGLEISVMEVENMLCYTILFMYLIFKYTLLNNFISKKLILEIAVLKE